MNAFLLQHIFDNHLLQPKNKEAILNEDQMVLWPSLVLLFAFIILVIIRVRSSKKFVFVVRSFFSFNACRQLVREEYSLNRGLSVLLIVFFVINFSLLLYFINDYYLLIELPFLSFINYLVICLFVSILYTLKILLLKLWGIINQESDQMNEYIFNVFVLNKAIGIFLFPLLMVMYFSHLDLRYFILAGLVITAFFYFNRLIRGGIIAWLSGKISIFHLFLYFCSLEILPLAVFIRWIIT